MSDKRTRYAIVGTGGRAKMYVTAIGETYKENGQIVALCDLSQVRMDWYNQQLVEEHNHPPLPTFHADHFDQMVVETKPDVVIVTTMDSTHHIYITRAMELGCDVICEKPMTIDAEKARAIFDTIERTGRNLCVTFNYRYSPITTTVRDVIMQGAIGRPLSVDFQWVLDTSHGADYFRRWHREKDKSGGLLVHKATHHFDLINWWLDSYPKRVFAMGDLLFYGRENAATRGEVYEYDRYTDQPGAANDPFALSLHKNDNLRSLYKAAEAETGYIRDRNVFGDNITAEDTMSIAARYRNGAILSYSLVAYSPWEGYRVAITGTKGRVEVDLIEALGKPFVAGEEESIEPEREAGLQFNREQVRVFPMFGHAYEEPIPEAKGGHGGADPVMLDYLFSAHPPTDPYERSASHIDGAASILVGIAANQSIESGLPVDVDTLLELPMK